MPFSLPQQLIEAVTCDNIPLVSTILRGHPELEINKKTPMGPTLLRIACSKNHHEIAFLLLAHPKIDVNDGGSWGSPFRSACVSNSVDCARLLLEDWRTDISTGRASNTTPMFWLVSGGHIEIVREWVASWRILYLWGFGVDPGITREKELLVKLRVDPVGVRQEVRMEMGWHTRRASEIFALVVFLSDGLLQGLAPLTPVFSKGWRP
jgi:hypothetical protein